MKILKMFKRTRKAAPKPAQTRMFSKTVSTGLFNRKTTYHFRPVIA